MPDGRRFCDEELHIMREDLTELRLRFEKHESTESIKFVSMINAVHLNTKSINELADETRAIVELHRDIQGTVRVGRSAQNFIAWLLKWGAVSAVVVAIGKWGSKFFHN